MNTEAERRFPVRIRIGLPPSGLGQRFTEMRAWLDENFGAGAWAITPAGTRDVLNDALSICVADAALVSAFVARWCVESRVGVVQVREAIRLVQLRRPRASCPTRAQGRRAGDDGGLAGYPYPWVNLPRRGAECCLEVLTLLAIASVRRRPDVQPATKARTRTMGGGNMNRPRAADDFATIRARMEQLRREREAAYATEDELQSDRPIRSNRNAYWSEREIGAGPGRVRRSGTVR
jgi:hypothetical protein